MKAPSTISRMVRGRDHEIRDPIRQNGLVLRIEPGLPGEQPEEVVYQETEAIEVDAFADFLRHIFHN